MRRLMIAILLLSLFFLDAVEVDSLYTRLNTTDTETLLNTFIELASYYDEVNNDSLRYYANRILHYPEISHYPLYTSKGHYLLGNALFDERKFDAARVEYNKSLSIAQVIDNPRMIGQNFSRMALMLAYEQSYYEAIHLFNKSTEQYKRINYAQGLSFNSCNAGLCYNFLGEFHNAIHALQYAIDNIQTYGEDEFLVNLYGNLGAIYTYLGDFEKSIEYSFLSLNISYEIGDSLATARQYNNIGNLLIRADRLTEAEMNFFRALDLFSTHQGQLQYRRGVGTALNNISLVYMYQEKYEKALDYALQCYNFKLSLPPEDQDLASSYNNIGLIYLYLDQYDSAEEYLLKSLRDETTRDGKWGKANTHINLAKLYRLTGKQSIAKNNLDIALSTAFEIDSTELVRDTYDEMQKYYTQYEQYDLALDAALKKMAYNDSLQKENSLQKLQNKALLHETQLKKEQIELMKIKGQTQSEKLVSERRTTTLLFMISIVLMLMGLFLILLLLQRTLHQRRQQEIHQQISDKQEHLQTKKQELTEMLAELHKLNEQKNRFLTIVANDLRQSFNALRSGSRMLSSNGNNISAKEAQEQAQALRISSDHLYHLLENLLKWSRSQIGNQHIEATSFDLHDVVRSILVIMQENARVNDITITNTLRGTVPVYADTTMISSVVMNVLANAIRFTPPDGTITLSTLQHSDNTILIIEDTGLGVVESDLAQFNAGISLESAPMAGRKRARSIGMVLSREFVVSNGGTLIIESNDGKGTKVSITLPRANPNSDG